jgi:hypothetical protein
LSLLPSVAVVILNWNGKHYLQQFLGSLLNTTYGNCRFIVADNASTDESISFVTANFPAVELIRLDRNYGFAKGYNEALKQVSSDYYVLLNSDVEVTPGWLEPIIGLLEQDASYAACQPKLLAFRNKDIFEYAGACGGWIDAFGYPFSRGRVFDYCEHDRHQYDDVQEVFWASGAALVIRSNLYHEVGGFDPFFFAHQEEIDMCWRLQRAGYKILCCPQSVVYHVGGGTLPKGHSRKTFLNFRNNQVMLWKNLPRSEKWWKIPLRLVLDWVSGLKGLIGGDSGYFVSIIKGHYAFAVWMMQKRGSGFLHERRPLRNLKGVYNGNIAWQHFVRKKKTFSSIVKN